MTQNASGTGRGRIWAWAALVCIVALGLGLRLYRIEHESAWYDEVITMRHVDAPDLKTFFYEQRYTNWNAVPVYYTLEYWWGNTVGASVLSFRVLSILFGMLAIPLIFLFGRDLFGVRAGLVAALCLALSSVHVFQAQEVRNYSLTMLTALLSAYSFFKLVERRTWPWWVFNIAANLLLVWTHLFGCFVLVAAGLSLLLFHRRPFRWTALWFVLNLLLMLPSIMWIRSMEPVQYYAPPAPQLWMMLNGMLTDCKSATLCCSLFPGYDWQIAATPFSAFLERTYPQADAALLAVFLLGLAYVGWRVGFQGVASPERPPVAANGCPVRERFFFLLFWLVIPSLILWSLAFPWRTDTFSPKYTAHSSLAAYLLIGGAVAHLRRPWLRVMAVGLLVALFGHRAALTATHPQRPDWFRATDGIKAGYRPGEVLVMFPWWEAEVPEYNMRPLAPEVRGTQDLRAFCEAVEGALTTGNGVWAIWTGGFGNVDFVERFGAYLDARGVTFSRKAYWGGMKCIFVFHIGKDSGFVPLDETARTALFERVTSDYESRYDGTGEAKPIEK